MTHVQTQIVLFISGMFFFVGCNWTGQENHNLYKGIRTTESAETVNVEEIRGAEGQNVLGYLEEELYKPKGTTGERTIYYIYDQHYETIKGFISDTGDVTKIIQQEKETALGPMGFKKGVKRILDHEGELQFYREGEQVYH